MSRSLTVHENFEAQNQGFERLQRKREFRGLKLWAMIFRRVQAAFVQRDKAIQCELMQLESIVKSGDESAALERIEKVKALLALLCIGSVSLMMCAYDDEWTRPLRSARRGREELCA